MLENEAHLRLCLVLGNPLYFSFLCLSNVSLFIKIPILIIGSIIPLITLLCLVMFVVSFFSMVWATRKGCTCSWELVTMEFSYSNSRVKTSILGVTTIIDCPYHRETHEKAIVKAYVKREKKDLKSLLTHKNVRVRLAAKKLQ